MKLSMFRKADTPIKRVGILFIASSIVLWFGTMLHWNLFHRGFLYQYNYTWTEQAPTPDSTPKEHWVNDIYRGWQAYDRKCLEEQRERSAQNFREKGIMTLDSVIMDRCRIKSVPHKQHSAYKWRTSLDDYFEEFLDVKRGDYFMWNIAVIGLMVLGLLLFLGLLDRLIGWVKSGA